MSGAQWFRHSGTPLSYEQTGHQGNCAAGSEVLLLRGFLEQLDLLIQLSLYTLSTIPRLEGIFMAEAMTAVQQHTFFTTARFFTTACFFITARFFLQLHAFFYNCNPFLVTFV